MNYLEIDEAWELFNEMTSLEVDKLFHQTAAEEELKIDCTDCGKCCKALQPAFTNRDIANIEAEHSSIKHALQLDVKNQVHYLKESPCLFLQGKICSIYESRPESCADYPHLKLKHMKYRKKSVAQNYSICPIVTNTIKQLILKLA